MEGLGCVLVVCGRLVKVQWAMTCQGEGLGQFEGADGLFQAGGCTEWHVVDAR